MKPPPPLIFLVNIQHTIHLILTNVSIIDNFSYYTYGLKSIKRMA